MKKKTIVIHQPDFIPYIGFFHRLLDCDLFIILDHVQLLARGWHHRDQIKGPGGKHWLTVPINRTVKNPPINKAEIDYSSNWVEKHLKTITHFYKKAPFFNSLYPQMEAIYHRKYSMLIDLNIALLNLFTDLFAISVETTMSSSFEIQSKKSELILALVQAANGTHYLSGLGARDYLDQSLFANNGIRLLWQDFQHPVYPQLHGDFIPHLSCLDFAMNCGPALRNYL
ncbi:WbqC family protein [Thermodesulfobacteriota bacterium]